MEWKIKENLFLTLEAWLSKGICRSLSPSATYVMLNCKWFNNSHKMHCVIIRKYFELVISMNSTGGT